MPFEPKSLCRKCGERRYVGDFRFLPSGQQSSVCDVCVIDYQREWKRKPVSKDIIRWHNQKAQKEKRAMCLLAAAKRRARKKGVAFAVSLGERTRLQAVIDAGVCQLSGLPFNMEAGVAFCVDSPSIDRIEPALGYTDGNLRVILYGLNAAIGSWGYEKLLQMVQACENH